VTRDVDGDGLVAAIHNWETGLDASPAYDPAFNVYITDELVSIMSIVINV
jgi:hypothetical protein